MRRVPIATVAERANPSQLREVMGGEQDLHRGAEIERVLAALARLAATETRHEAKALRAKACRP